MRLPRPFIATTVLLAAALAVPAQARVVAPVELTATTVLTAQRSGYVDVVVPVDARVSAKVEGNPDVVFSGGGRLVGFWLERESATVGGFTDSLSSTRLPAFLGGRQHTYGSYAGTQQCTGTPEAFPVAYDCPDSTTPPAILLHEGRYRLTVLADGSPLRITLTLHGLDSGTTELSPRTNLASVQKALPRRDGIDNTLVTFGATAPLKGNVATWVMATAKGSASPAFEEWSICARADEGDAPALGYGPHCPDGVGGHYSYEVHVAGQTYGGMGGFVTASSEVGTRDVGVGGSFGDSGGVTLGQTLGVWMQIP